ncbi:MAG: dienelactone hydrolase family protein, partial [Fidelibacterota bacterium]
TVPKPVLLLCLVVFFNCGLDSDEKKEDYPQEVTVESIPDGSGFSYLCRPPGKGPFPAVLYNHGGFGQNVGGDLEGTCRALAEAGYLARAEKRRETVSLEGHLNEVLTALDELQSHKDADTDRTGIMGFSRGGLLTLQASIVRSDEIHAVILMAPAAGGNSLNEALQQVSAIAVPVLILVAKNDLYQDNHVQPANDVYDALLEEGKDVTLIVYPEYDANGDGTIDQNDDGHELFWKVQEPYWNDVLEFLLDVIGE